MVNGQPRQRFSLFTLADPRNTRLNKIPLGAKPDRTMEIMLELRSYFVIIAKQQIRTAEILHHSGTIALRTETINPQKVTP